MVLLIGFIGAFALSVATMPLILMVAKRYKLYDTIDERKIHKGSIPRLGGVGIVVAFAITLIALTKIGGLGISTGGRFWVILVAMVAVHLLGLVDDFKDLRARFKFLVELIAALTLVLIGFRFRTILVPWGSGSIELGFLSYPITLVWIIGVTNALNLLDGMDGLAGGVSALAAFFFGLFFLLRGNSGSALACFALVGAISGFLVFNFPPAKIFMGDCGSLSLGFILSLLPLLGPASGVVEIGFISTVTVLLIPIYDTFAAIIRRTRAGVPFFTADKLHLHHKLLSLDLGVKGALGVIYATQILLGLIALTTFFLPASVSFALKIGSWLVLAALFCLLSTVVRKRAARTILAARLENEAAAKTSGAYNATASTRRKMALRSALFSKAFNEHDQIK